MINFFLVILAGLFTYLKLTGATAVATWSWFWVLSPIIILYAIVISFVILTTLIVLIAGGKPTVKFGKK